MPQARHTTLLVNLLAWAAAIWIAYELLYYEQFKLTGPTLIFDRLSDWSGIPEKPFRLFVAGMEIVAAILVLIPRTQGFGGLFAAGIMGGAIFFHLFTPLGVDPYEDGGKLFKEACFTFSMGLLLAWLRRDQLLALLPRRAAVAA
ncbi:DoxX family protein [Roseococcus sp. SDR]|uniref:DoxX family protein n=1 Tax=Roseococcus sp. SDR TaxID=2835532 RepID=UPI001BCABBAD|nr:DoxX family protein [Roseococcus sp. SDR]MBS7788398.1 DoxX family protein [Roseococcus sp. SDR]MBV1843712.1 DoxX family protein [Roseococcus sp. SDR]